MTMAEAREQELQQLRREVRELRRLLAALQRLVDATRAKIDVPEQDEPGPEIGGSPVWSP